MKHDVKPEQKTSVEATSPPAKHSLPLPLDPSGGVGCPYAGVGFIFWSPDGSCMRTDVEKFSRRSKGR